MDYTDDQYALMEKLAKHVSWYSLSEDERDTLSYLDRERIARPRADIADGLWTLSHDGERVLASHRQKIRTSVIQTRKELEALQAQELVRQENIRKEHSAIEENNRILEAERTSREKEKRSDRRFQLFLAIFQASLSFVAGILLEHFTGIVDFIIRLFD